MLGTIIKPDLQKDPIKEKEGKPKRLAICERLGEAIALPTVIARCFFETRHPSLRSQESSERLLGYERQRDLRNLQSTSLEIDFKRRVHGRGSMI